MKYLCIYHSNCADGFGSALVVKMWLDKLAIPEEDREFMPAHYGDKAPDVTGKNVVVVDFSYPRETLLEMHEKAMNLVVIDHHKTAKDALGGLYFCFFDMLQSGAMLTWNHFFPHGYVGSSETPKLIEYIQDRDLWAWSLENSKEVSAALQSLPMTFEAWEPYLDDEKIQELIIQGSSILRYQQQQVEKISKTQLPMIHLCGHNVPCVNTTTLISEIGGEISKNHPFAVMYFDTSDHRIYSLRSQKNEGVDVSEVAKQFGGGGHRNAAGFTIGREEMLACSVITPEGSYLISAEQAFKFNCETSLVDTETLEELGDSTVVSIRDFYQQG